MENPVTQKHSTSKTGKYNICPRWVTESLTLIHYGSERFEKKLFRKIINNDWTKPIGGLWTSPTGSTYGWKEWCLQEDFRIDSLSSHFKLKFTKEARVLLIDSFPDLEKLPKRKVNYLDFEKISNKFDAIWLTEKGQWETRFTRPFNLYGWDCESILVLNPESVEEI